MKFFNTTKLAQVLSVQAGIDGMKAENARYKIGTYAPYGEKDFDKMAARLLTLSKLPDYILYRVPEKEKKVKEIVEVEVENAPKYGDIGEYLGVIGLRVSESEEFSKPVDQVSKGLYFGYCHYCKNYSKSTPLSVVKFAYALDKMGAYKRRKVDGQTYIFYRKP